MAIENCEQVSVFKNARAIVRWSRGCRNVELLSGIYINQLEPRA